MSHAHIRRGNTVIAAGIFGLLGVAAGAFGAHGLEGKLGVEQLQWWHTAARYQQIHAVALLAVGLVHAPWTRWRQLAALGFIVGMLIFSGTLYAMALGAPRILGAITPLGGLGLIFAWLALVIYGWRLRSEAQP